MVYRYRLLTHFDVDDLVQLAAPRARVVDTPAQGKAWLETALEPAQPSAVGR
jgi:hypothetical protein